MSAPARPDSHTLNIELIRIRELRHLFKLYTLAITDFALCTHFRGVWMNKSDWINDYYNQPPHKILTALRSPPPRPPCLPFGDQARGVQCQSEVFRPGQVPGLRGSHGHLRDHCHRSRVENTWTLHNESRSRETNSLWALGVTTITMRETLIRASINYYDSLSRSRDIVPIYQPRGVMISLLQGHVTGKSGPMSRVFVTRARDKVVSSNNNTMMVIIIFIRPGHCDAWHRHNPMSHGPSVTVICNGSSQHKQKLDSYLPTSSILLLFFFIHLMEEDLKNE